jgi:hypothetical protein
VPAGKMERTASNAVFLGSSFPLTTDTMCIT